MSSPKMPSVANNVKEPVAAPTYADAKVTKASTSERNRLAGLAGRNIKTSSRGLADDVNTDKKKLLGE